LIEENSIPEGGGVLEYWNDGMMENWADAWLPAPNIPLFHHSLASGPTISRETGKGNRTVIYRPPLSTLTIWGRVAKKTGARSLLWIGGIGIVPLSAGWLLSQHLAWLMMLQIIGGVFWAAYELAFFLLFFESIAEEERTSVLTLYNLLNTMAWVGGSLIGGVILFSFDSSYGGVYGLTSLP
jgi:MFS family permease